jgi:hypothetical protein
MQIEVTQIEVPQPVTLQRNGNTLDAVELARDGPPLRNRGICGLCWYWGAIIGWAWRKLGRAFLFAFQALVLSSLLFVLFALTFGIGVSVFSDVVFLIVKGET